MDPRLLHRRRRHKRSEDTSRGFNFPPMLLAGAVEMID
jgi:hypothetical protein